MCILYGVNTKECIFSDKKNSGAVEIYSWLWGSGAIAASFDADCDIELWKGKLIISSIIGNVCHQH